MKRLVHLAALLTAASTFAAAPLAAQTAAEERRFDEAQARFDRELQIFQDEYRRYQDARARGGPAYYDDDRYENGYDAARYYRPGNYRERVMTADERVYRGMDGRYYCRRSDGTTGLIAGGAAGGILGNVIDGGRSRTVGTLLGAAAGALAGRAIEQQNQEIRCR